jgi:hypothetical protein
VTSLEGGLQFEEYRRRYPDRLIFVTEFSNPSRDVADRWKGHQYLEFYRMARQARGVGAVFAWALSATEGHDSVVWRKADGTRTAVAEVVGGRTR